MCTVETHTAAIPRVVFHYNYFVMTVREILRTFYHVGTQDELNKSGEIFEPTRVIL